MAVFDDYTYNIGTTIQSGVTESTDGTRTVTTSQIVDALCEGPINGFPNPYTPLKFIYLDGTPVQDISDNINVGDLRCEFRNGTPYQNPLSQYATIGEVSAPSYAGEIYDIADTANNGASIVQQVQIRDDSNGSYIPIEAVAFTFSFPEGIYRMKQSGGNDNTGVTIKIELNNRADGSGTTYVKVDDRWNKEITVGFDVTYVIEIPPGWTTPAGLQGYSDSSFADDVVRFTITKYDSDYGNDRAHTKLFLKNYSVYTKNRYSFPYTAVAGITIDSKNFDGSVPKRMYELELLRVKVPSNYTITKDAKTGRILTRTYTGTWDGTFKPELTWTDNPAWCFYDLVTNERYGLGKYIDPSLLNKWKLYEIAKYCDAVVQSGSDYVFSIPGNLGGVPAAAGSSAIKEPRFTCNVLITNREEAYSLVQKMASLFRGITYFQHGMMQILQDKPSYPIYTYNNTNAVGGVFIYASSSAKARHTVAAVKWVDPDDLYSEKIEYVEDLDGISRYGYRQLDVEGFGATSRGQAYRIGKHILITEKFELETVSFKVGMEGGIVQPGHLIKIKDSNRQDQRVGGRIVSATTNSIVLDSGVTIPSGATNIKLWVETATTRNEAIESSTSPTYRPTLTYHNITQGANGTYTTLNISSTNYADGTAAGSTFPTTPVAGNIWILSYTPSGTVENTSVYKILSVTENDNYEYEITALQHYSAKYNDIETFRPIPVYKPPPLVLSVFPVTDGWFSVVPSNTVGLFNITVNWRADRALSGAAYRLESVYGLETKVLLYKTTSTTFTLYNAKPGTYFFKVYALNSLNKITTEPFVIGPVLLKMVMPTNTFSTFEQSEIGDKYVTHSWLDDEYSNDELAYELWRSESAQLRQLITSHNITAINPLTKVLTLGSPATNIDDVPGKYRVEAELFPYVRYRAANLNAFGIVANTSTTLVAINSLEKPDINIGDKLVNSTRYVTSTVISMVSTKTPQGRYFTRLTIEPAISGQTAGDVVYGYKGVLGASFNITEPSCAIKQRTLKTVTGTTTTTVVTATGGLTNVLVGDIIVNKTRAKAAIITAKANNQEVTVPAITSQTVGDTIAIYQHSIREPRFLKKFRIANPILAYGGNSFNLKDFSSLEQLPKANESILINLTRDKATEIISVISGSGYIVTLVTYPAISGIAEDDEVIILNKNEVFSASLSTHIHPTAGLCTSVTNATTVTTTTTAFTSAVVGDILVNATRNTSGVITAKASNSQVTIASIGEMTGITGQVSGDVVFTIPASSAFVENTTFAHPTIYTASNTPSTTTATNLSCSNAFVGVLAGDVVHNVTRKASAVISVVGSSNNVTLTGAGISGQVSTDEFYVFRPRQVTTTIATAPDGAFKYARPGDVFFNATRNQKATIKQVVTLTGDLDNRVDKLILNTPITSQAAGDSFVIYQGIYSAVPQAFTSNSATMYNIGNLNPGDRVNIYKMTAKLVGRTTGNTLTDINLGQSTTYYYYMRAVGSRNPYITGTWLPNDTTGDSATTVPIDLGNYNTSNDNNANPITIPPVVRTMVTDSINQDGTCNLLISWQWFGLGSSLDGFILYLWSSKYDLDELEVEHSSAQTTMDKRMNPIIPIQKIGVASNVVTITTTIPHGLKAGHRFRINGIVDTNSDREELNRQTNTASYYKVASVLSTTSFTTSRVNDNPGTAIPVDINEANITGLTNVADSVALASPGSIRSCMYTQKINNLATNKYYNSFLEAYRKVNTAISENGVITGTPVRVWEP